MGTAHKNRCNIRWIYKNLRKIRKILWKLPKIERKTARNRVKPKIFRSETQNTADGENDAPADDETGEASECVRRARRRQSARGSASLAAAHSLVSLWPRHICRPSAMRAREAYEFECRGEMRGCGLQEKSIKKLGNQPKNFFWFQIILWIVFN